MQISVSVLCASLFAAAALAFSQSPDAPQPVRERDWKEVLGPSRGTWTNPRPKLQWLEDFDEAKAIAAREGRPLFVVMRCLPCKQCANFDAEVLEGGPILEPLLRQFVTVRLTSVHSVDLRQFPMQSMQDLDLSWWGWFLSPEGSIYGVFGGKDEHGDNSRISGMALATTLRRVLDHHHDPRRADWNLDPKPAAGAKPLTPFELPGFKSWARRFDDPEKLNCLHCHQVAEVLRQPAIDAKTFDKARDLQLWPYPENLGLVLARDDGLKVSEVVKDSAAARAGIQVGDRIATAKSKKLFSQADLRAVLQHVDPDGEPLLLRWMRGKEVIEGKLVLEQGWKSVVLDWRQSIAGGNIGANPGFAWPTAVSDGDRRKLNIAPQSMAIRPFFGKTPGWLARRAGLSTSDTILAVNGQSPNLSDRPFLVWFRTRFEPGDEIRLQVRDSKGAVRELVYTSTASGR
jgi:hypothetical protein